MGKIDENKLHKRNTMLQTAFELFTTKGETKTSISDIVEKAGVAKGTFYLYFKDKIDIKNKLIAHKTSKLFEKALDELERHPQETFPDRVIFVIDYILNSLIENPALLLFIYKNLSWGICRNVMSAENSELRQTNIYIKIITEECSDISNPELMLYMIIEMTSSVSYSSILYNEPVPINELKPHIYQTVRTIINQYKKKPDIDQKDNNII